ncbi:general secretion pathway protein GspK [Pseudomonas asplenii]|uniref:general secretion pathway protein GspK n=1 Tax=Pseudomonas asplenii TaxID=53407 RepID=UPI0022344C7A|nr:general secretion pathway protein GspK [Pseudomonas asplenii]UZE27778.1 general secretion pathway protein GspK [Pseudomonas asplenii]
MNTPAMDDARGAALVLALWALALLSLMMAVVVGTVRLENRQSAYALQRTRALLAAESGLAWVVRDLSSNPPAMIADGRRYQLTIEDAQLSIELQSERGKIDLNQVSAKDFDQVVRYLGASPEQGRRLSGELLARRSAANPPRVVEELQLFAAMDRRLYARLAPNLTLWTGLARPDTRLATAPLRAALKLPAAVLESPAGPIYSAQITSALTTAVSATLNVTFLLNPQAGGTQLYRVLRWQE